MRLNRRRTPNPTKLEKTASRLGSGVLVDHLKQHISRAGTAIRTYEDGQDPRSLELLAESAQYIATLTKELRSRVKVEDFVPVPDLHLQRLIAEFEKHNNGSKPPGVA